MGGVFLSWAAAALHRYHLTIHNQCYLRTPTPIAPNSLPSSSLIVATVEAGAEQSFQARVFTLNLHLEVRER